MQYEEKFGVKVDIQIPQSSKRRLYEQFEECLDGGVSDYLTLEDCNLMTRYEHFILGSGVGLLPDPFKPLCAQHRKADLIEIIEARRKSRIPGKEYFHFTFPHFVVDFEEVTGLKKYGHSIIIHAPDINTDGRVNIPKIVGVYAEGKRKIELSDKIIEKLRFKTSGDDLKLEDGCVIKEVFDFENGYKIELVKIIDEED